MHRRRHRAFAPASRRESLRRDHERAALRHDLALHRAARAHALCRVARSSGVSSVLLRIARCRGGGAPLLNRGDKAVLRDFRRRIRSVDHRLGALRRTRRALRVVRVDE